MNRKPLFDAIRKLLGRGFRQAEVEALDKAIDTVAGRAPNGGARSMGPQGLALIRQFEGCARLRPDGMVEAYPDPGTGGEPWTIGWGATGSAKTSCPAIPMCSLPACVTIWRMRSGRMERSSRRAKWAFATWP